MLKVKKHRYCVKIINNKTYLYKWTYIRKCDRNRHYPRSYEWKCVGGLNNPRTKRLLKRIDAQEAANIQRMFDSKQQELDVFLQQKEQLLKEEPFITEYKTIMQINNSKARATQFKQFQNKIKRIITKESD